MPIERAGYRAFLNGWNLQDVMDDRTNIIAMMVLGAGVVALGGTVMSGEYFKAKRPEKMGYIVEGVEAEGDAAVANEPPIEALLAKADPAKGAEVFKKCASCHTVNNGGANGIGPNLWGTLGEEIGHGKAGFAFSEALAKKGGSWGFQNMNEWLKKPSAFAPGTKMSFAGLSKGEDRANLLAYLNTQGSNLPLPAAPGPDATKPTAAGTDVSKGGAERPGGQQGANKTGTPPGEAQPGGTPKGTSAPATKQGQ